MRTACRFAIVAVWASLLPIVIAQSNPEPASNWEFEVHGGAATSNHPTGGVGTLPPGPGISFTTIDGNPSRKVYSWFFGDGAVLLNQVQALAPASPERLVPLDSVLTSAVVRRTSGGVVGVRLSRRLTSLLSAEFNADFCVCRWMVTDSG